MDVFSLHPQTQGLNSLLPWLLHTPAAEVDATAEHQVTNEQGLKTKQIGKQKENRAVVWHLTCELH